MLTCDVLFSVKSGSVPVPNAIVSVALEGVNNVASGHLIVTGEVTGVTDAEGNCTVKLIQGGEFKSGGQYRITVTSDGKTFHDRMVIVPNAATANAVILGSV